MVLQRQIVTAEQFDTFLAQPEVDDTLTFDGLPGFALAVRSIF